MIKIDNVYPAWPQSGIGDADVIYEEMVEGGLTRYLAVFQSRGASQVGPIRSVRASDADIAWPIGGLFAYSGGIPDFVHDLHATGVTDVGAIDDGGAYYRSSSRPAPHNLYSSTSVLRQQTPAGAGPPPHLFKYLPSGKAFDPAGSTPLTQLTVSYSGATTAEWTYQPSSDNWARTTDGTPQSAIPTGPLVFTNVIIQYVNYTNTGFVDPAGNPVPMAVTVGSGTGYAFSGGRLVPIRWSKSAPAAVTQYYLGSGSPLLIQPGTTFVMLVPVGQAITTVPAATTSTTAVSSPPMA
jgi:hypothetical protein